MTDRPNVLFVLTDDQGWWASGCYGNPEIRTPNMDRLAAAGMRFDRFFCASPVCSPSRASFLTGRIPSQHGVHDWIREGHVGDEAIRYLEGEFGYTDQLARAGYTCGLSGKWHLGDSQIPQHGFSTWFTHQTGGSSYYNAPVVRNGQLATEPRYITDVITDEALVMMDHFHENARPWYLSVHYTAPHSPWRDGNHPQELLDSYDDCPFASCPQEDPHPWIGSLADCLGDREALKGYFAAVTAMDMNLGRLLDRLEQLGQRENTLIVFTSDNGFSCGHHGFWGKGNGTNPRNMYENSIRIPFIASHPGRIPEGSSTEEMVSACDFAPTLLDYLGLPPMPEKCNLPGSSVRGILEGEPGAGRDSIVIYDEYGPVRMIRTKEWKYVYRHAYGPHELYHLAEDPDERVNLVDHADHADTVTRLRQQMDDWFEQYVIPQRDGYRTDGVIHGQTRRMW